MTSEEMELLRRVIYWIRDTAPFQAPEVYREDLAHYVKLYEELEAQGEEDF